MISFAERHVAARELCGLSQEQAARLLGVTRQRIGSWERGVASPTKDMLIKLADFYGVSADWLLGFPVAPLAHPELAAHTAELRAYLKGLKPGLAVRQSALEWLIQVIPQVCNWEFLARRLKTPAADLRKGNLGSAAIGGLVELTGIGAEYWNSGAPGLLDAPAIRDEASRLLYLLASGEPPISVDVVRRELGYLRGRAAEHHKK